MNRGGGQVVPRTLAPLFVRRVNRPRATRVTGTLGAAVALAALWYLVLSPRSSLLYGTDTQARRTWRMLHSSDPEQRKRGAWRLLDYPDARCEDFIRRGALGDEPSPDVREAYVYTLGRRGNPRDVRVLVRVIHDDPSGYVRSAAWLALARVDPKVFRRHADEPQATRDAWNRLGIAVGRLFLRDLSAIPELLDWAEKGDYVQRVVAARALNKSLIPLLDAIGRWPAYARIRPDEPWPADLVRDVRRRVLGINLPQLARETLAQLRATEEFRSQLRRVLHAQDWLADRLFEP